ncbi:toxin VapC-like [Candidatus Termititenax aidoneus]|uniref:Ribonuclease VapC n=1 Tax=Termititenax aidoneus TaxID=2218524 RepID=A0A388TDR1_TERA1|nr:toxin VapC-like [Candidatus Termititenax aidoneus]
MYLLDTNIIIYSLKNDKNVQAKFTEYAKIPKCISIITYGELLYGAQKSEQAEKNCAKVYRIRNLFPVIPIDLPIIETFSGLKSNYSKLGITIDDFDLLIAATALTHNQTLVTNNTKHFAKIKELKTENWK